MGLSQVSEVAIIGFRLGLLSIAVGLFTLVLPAGCEVDDDGDDPVVDAGPDAGPDARPDAGPDGGPDAGPDGGPDAGPDAGPDGGMVVPGLLTDPTDDCSGGPCDPEMDITEVEASCTGSLFYLDLATVGGISNTMPPGKVYRAGCSMKDAEIATQIVEFKCIYRNEGPWDNQFITTLNGVDLTIGPDEGCNVLGGKLRMAIDSSQFGFDITVGSCSSGVSEGPGTTVNDFTGNFPFDTACTQ